MDNVLGALTIAGHYTIPETCVYFNRRLFRGNRVIKGSTTDLNAFESPNFPPLAKVDVDIDVSWSQLLRQTNLRPFRAHKEILTDTVLIFRLFPGVTRDVMSRCITEKTRGVVLEAFGAGNAPQCEDLMRLFKETCDQGIVIVAVTQCAKGNTSDAYESGRTLLDAGVIIGGDMTTECAWAKLGYLLSKQDLSTSDVRELMISPLRGELTVPTRRAPNVPSQNFDKIQECLSEFVRLLLPSRATNLHTPKCDIRGHRTSQVAASWAPTMAESSHIEAALLPFLIRLAAGRNDEPGLKFCLEAGSYLDPETLNLDIAGGLVNCADPVTKLTPLHIAGLNGSTECIVHLLKSGALVHQKDKFGHTALFYAAQQAHGETVDILVQAGSTLSDVDIPFASHLFNDACINSTKSANIWLRAGVDVKIKHGHLDSTLEPTEFTDSAIK